MSPSYSPSFPLLDPSHILHMPFTEPLPVKLSFSSASFTHSSDPAKNTDKGASPPSQPPAPRPLFPRKTALKHPAHTVHTAQAPRDSFQKTSFSSITEIYSSREWGSYLCRCIPQTGSSCPLSFHFNNACSNGSQARAI